MGIDACAKLIYGFPIDIGDNDELYEMIHEGDEFPFIWKNPSEYAEREEIYIVFTDFSAYNYTAECLGPDISAIYKHDPDDIEQFCIKYNIEQKTPLWYLIPYYF